MKFESIFFARARQHGRVSGLSVLILVLLVVSGRASAQVDPWELEVYPYATEARGMAQFESGNAVVAKGHSQAGNGTSGGTFPSEGTWYQHCRRPSFGGFPWLVIAALITISHNRIVK